MSTLPPESAPTSDFPEFDLGYRLDDDEEEVTVFPDDPDDLSTEWLTIDADFSLPIEETV